jgi:hypothetical protein
VSLPNSPRAVIGASIRYKVAPRDIAPSKAARLLGITLTEFNRLREELFARGFPRPDPTTGNYDQKAVEAWQDARSGLSPPVRGEPVLRDAGEGFAERAARLLNGQR